MADPVFNMLLHPPCKASSFNQGFTRKEAREVRDKLISEAKGKASQEAEKLIEKARTGIESEKLKALSEIHEQVATLSVDIASKLLGEKLKQTGEQEKIIDNYLREIDFNKN